MSDDEYSNISSVKVTLEVTFTDNSTLEAGYSVAPCIATHEDVRILCELDRAANSPRSPDEKMLQCLSGQIASKGGALEQCVSTLKVKIQAKEAAAKQQIPLPLPRKPV